MAELLGEVAERIVQQNETPRRVKEINKCGDDSTYVDFVTSQFGLEWSKTDDLGGWQPIAVEKRDDEDENVYRVWFQ